jgi:hypothetical protein
MTMARSAVIKRPRPRSVNVADLPDDAYRTPFALAPVSSRQCPRCSLPSSRHGPAALSAVWRRSVGVGLVPSLNGPGGEGTGFSALVPGGFSGKEAEFLKEAVPHRGGPAEGDSPC